MMHGTVNVRFYGILLTTWQQLERLPVQSDAT